MSLNLIAQYGSDADSSENEDDFFSKPVIDAEQKVSTSNYNLNGDKKMSEQNKDEASTSHDLQPLKGESASFFFSPNAGNDDSDDDEAEQGDTKIVSQRKRKNHSAVDLPTNFKSDIFDNNYAREERLHTQMLSQHVELCEKPSFTQRKSKFTCRAYLKGKCRLGDACRFAHPVHERGNTDFNETNIESKAHMYDQKDVGVPQVFHSKKFKSS